MHSLYDYVRNALLLHAIRSRSFVWVLVTLRPPGFDITDKLYTKKTFTDTTRACISVNEALIVIPGSNSGAYYR